MRDIAERPAVHERRAALERLHQIWIDGVLEQQRHRALCLEIAGAHRALVAAQTHDDAGQPRFEIGDPRRQRQNRHDLRAGNDDEVLFPRRTGIHAPQSDDEVTQRAVVHVNRARPGNAADIEPERIAMMQLRVEHGGQQIVRARDRVEIAREMEVDDCHGDDLGIAAARRAAFHPEHGTERWLPDRENRILAEFSQRLRDADGDGGLALARGRGVDAGHEHEPAFGGPPVERADRDLRLVLAVELDLVVRQSELRRDVANRPQLCGLGDSDVRRNAWRGGGHSVESMREPKQRRAFAVVCCTRLATVSPRSSAARAATSRTKPGSLRRPRCGTGARYGASVSSRSRSAGHSLMRCCSVQFLKVIMPLNEKYALIASPASQTASPDEKLCNTTAGGRGCRDRSSAAMSASAWRACTMTGLPSSAASASCAAKALRWISRGACM